VHFGTDGLDYAQYMLGDFVAGDGNSNAHESAP